MPRKFQTAFLRRLFLHNKMKNIQTKFIKGHWTRVENSNEVFLRVTNHTGQAQKNLLGPAGIRTRDLRFTKT